MMVAVISLAVHRDLSSGNYYHRALDVIQLEFSK